MAPLVVGSEIQEVDTVNIKKANATCRAALGVDSLSLVLLDHDGKETGITEEDFAVAFVDEIERPQLVRKRVAIGY